MEEKIWYFAYGSNMSAKKFTDSRGIRPLDTARVRLPGWTMLMNIPGLPYSEPAFSSVVEAKSSEKSSKTPEVIGIAYLITYDQYIRVIGSEGGGTAYSNILVDAEPVSEKDSLRTGPRLVVRTLGTAISRYPPARPSQRYLDILNLGAMEANLPPLYRKYLEEIPAYTPSRRLRARIGAALFLCIWSPAMLLMEKLTNVFLQDNGMAPLWVIWLVRGTVTLIWYSHDIIFAPVFGRGDGLGEKNTDLEESEFFNLGST